jgi:molybdopterin synthase sulfur carrier subunit
MKLEIITFGKIAEFLERQHLELIDVRTTDELQAFLEESYPILATLKYKLALNKCIINSNVQLADSDVIAIMPPFSGG